MLEVGHYCTLINTLENLEPQFDEVLSKIQHAKLKAYSQVNATLVALYWYIGEYIAQKVNNAEWGKGVVAELSVFINSKAPDVKGFSDKNLWRMKQFYETYQHDEKLATLWRQLSWSHNRRIMTINTLEEREFYLQLCVKQKYSVRELDRLIKTSTFERTMLADQKLSATVKQLPQSASGVFKDSYVFEFLDLPIPHQEKDLQHALLASLKEFILELGIGFTFIGQEYRLQVGADDFYIDLLFYHRQLQCLVAFELKTEKFSPTVISEYETKLIPKELLRNKLNEFYALLEEKKEGDL